MTIRQGTTIISGGGGGKVTSVNGEIGDVVVKSVVNEKDNSTQLKFWLGTQEEYEQITEKDASTLYYTSGEDSSAISYDDLTDKPTINTVPLSGDMTLAELGIQGELQAGTGITIENNVISATVVGGVTSVNGQTGDVTVEGLKDQNTVNTGLLKFWTGTKEQYAEIETKDPNTLYYVGETLTPATLATVATTGLYADLLEKPQINNVELTGNKTLTELGIAATSDLSTIATSGSYNDATDKPQINTVILEGNQTSSDLGLQDAETALNYNNITNCITKIPQDIKLELNDGILTLKAGSKVYKGDGTVINITSDRINNDTSKNGQYFICINVISQSVEVAKVSTSTSGADKGDVGTFSAWYDTTNKIVYRYGGDISSGYEVSLPIAIVTMDSTGTKSIDQVFNGFGYIGSSVFTLPGLEMLLPNGLNDDGTLNNIKYTMSKVQIRKDANRYIAMNPTGGIGSANDFIIKDYYTEDFIGYLYNTSTNLMYAFDTIPEPAPRCILAELTFVPGDNKIISLKPRTICNIPTFNDVVTKDEYLTENEIQRQIFNRIYDGRDLTKVFANEIAKYSDEWAWIKARISAANYEGLYVGDYIPVTMNAGTVGGASIAQQIFQCQIAGIDTYTGCGDTEIGHHIDFISREVINSTVTWNPENNNNGTSVQANPWLASQAYAYLNGVNNYTTSAYNNVAHGGDYSAGGILQLLPTKLTNLIVTKRNLLDSRYDSTKLLTYSTTWAWGDMGKLWLPNEIEVYGTQIRSNLGYAQGYWNTEANIAVAYPIYLGSGRNRIKRVSSGGRSYWWLSSADSHNSMHVCYVDNYGIANSYGATVASIRCPLCFRIA